MVLEYRRSGLPGRETEDLSFEGGRGKSEEVIGALSQLEFGSHHFCKREPPTVSEKGDDVCSGN